MSIFDKNAPAVPYFVEPVSGASYGQNGKSVTQDMYYVRARTGLRLTAVMDGSNNSIPEGTYEGAVTITRRDGAVFVVEAGDRYVTPPVFLRKTNADRQRFADLWTAYGGAEPSMPQQYTDTPKYPA
ncbi:TPA: hypothetical protein U2T46_002981 [Burkholderia cenocepacia]|nr:hypothetical protein [Burkholderia cenocepacia]